MISRYVALGDSTTEGLDDPDGAGGFRGWADRLAALIAHHNPVAYANLAVRGKVARQIKDEQLAAAVALAPDLATVVAGMNDLLRGRFDAHAIAEDIAEMQRVLVAAGARVVSVTLPDLSHRLAVGPLSRLLSKRTALLNDAVRAASATTGAILVDLAQYPLARDPRLWSLDRLHLNPEGHARTAAAIAYALELPGSDRAWLDPLPEAPPPTLAARVGEQLAWGRSYFAPWLWRRLRGRTMGDDRTAKRPGLAPVVL